MTAKHRFTEAIGQRICRAVADGESLNAIEKKGGPKRRSVRDWLLEYPEFAAAYEVARALRCDKWAEEIIGISDGVAGSNSIPAVAAARLAVDGRKWLLSKIRPGEFGDKVQHTGANGEQLIPPAQDDRQRIALVLMNIFAKARPAEEVEAAEVLEAAPEAAPRRLLLSDAPREAEDVLVVEPDPPPPNPRWTKDSRGQTRHVSEQQLGLWPARVVR